MRVSGRRHQMSRNTHREQQDARVCALWPPVERTRQPSQPQDRTVSERQLAGKDGVPGRGGKVLRAADADRLVEPRLGVLLARLAEPVPHQELG